MYLKRHLNKEKGSLFGPPCVYVRSRRLSYNIYDSQVSADPNSLLNAEASSC